MAKIMSLLDKKKDFPLVERLYVDKHYILLFRMYLVKVIYCYSVFYYCPFFYMLISADLV